MVHKEGDPAIVSQDNEDRQEGVEEGVKGRLVLGSRQGLDRDSVGEELHTDKHIDEEEEAHEQRDIRNISQGADDDLKHLLKVFPELC